MLFFQKAKSDPFSLLLAVTKSFHRFEVASSELNFRSDLGIEKFLIASYTVLAPHGGASAAGGE